MSTIDIWLNEESVTRLQAARSLCNTGSPVVTVRNAHGDEARIYPAQQRARLAYGSIQPPKMDCPAHGGNAQEARRYAALITVAAEIMELAGELAGELDDEPATVTA